MVADNIATQMILRGGGGKSGMLVGVFGINGPCFNGTALYQTVIYNIGGSGNNFKLKQATDLWRH